MRSECVIHVMSVGVISRCRLTQGVHGFAARETLSS